MPRPTINLEEAERAFNVISDLPCLLSQLDNDDRDMLTKLLQATLDAGYRDGFIDGVASMENRNA